MAMIKVKKTSFLSRLSFGLVVAGMVLMAPLRLTAAISMTLAGPDQMNLCDTVTMTNNLLNSGVVLSDLVVTNTLPSAEYSYLTNNSTIRLPDGTVWSNSLAEPVVSDGTNLIWDFSALATPSSVTNLLITEVFYNTTNVPEESYEWVELYNPANQIVSITNWNIQDAAPGKIDRLPEITFNPGEFVIIAGSTNAFLAQHPGYTGQVFQVADGTIGSGLNNFGDGVFLLNATSNFVDKMSYGSAASGFSPSLGVVTQGVSSARQPANVDTGTRNDWVSLPVPEPGEGLVPTGLQPADQIRITYQVSAACRTVSGQFFARASFVQGGAPLTDTKTDFVTVNPGDLTVTKTPLLQTAGGQDLIGWTVTVNNAGFGNAKNVVLTDRMAVGLALEYTSVVPTLTTNTLAGTEMIWDATAIPALTNLVPDQSVSVVITGRVVSCDQVYNQADVMWGCSTNVMCENTSSNGGTATAGVNLVDRNPRLGGYLAPAGTLMVPFCGSNNLTLHITNAPGSTVGMAYGIVVSNSLPAGWSVSGDSVDSNGVIHLGDIPAGGVTNITVSIDNLSAGCSYSLAAEPVIFTFHYTDACGHPFGPPTLWTRVQLVDFPFVSITKVMPASMASDAGPLPVEIYLTYSNLVGTEEIQFTDTYPASTNLSVANVSVDGYTNGNSIVWSNLALTGSGVYTARFDLAILSPCAGPDWILQNRLTAPAFLDCRGCLRPVVGNGEVYTTEINRGAACPPYWGGTGSCSYASVKATPTNLAEVCQPVLLRHSFTNFAGSTLPDWSEVRFISDVGGQNGESDTNSVTVRIDGSNLTAFCTSEFNGTNLVVDFAGLNASGYSNMATIATNLEITWEVITLETGRVEETSRLIVPACGDFAETVYWNVGESRLTVALEPIMLTEACGMATGRIELSQWVSPGLMSGTNGVFPSYAVEVELDLDADGDQDTVFSYVTNSTVFTNMLMLGGGATNGFDPVIVSNKLIWTIGDLQANGVGALTYVLRGSCSGPVGEQQVARVRYATRCADARGAVSETNAVPGVSPSGNLVVDIQPQMVFLSDTQYVVRLNFLNTGAGTAFNVTPTLSLPSNIVFDAASVTNVIVTSSNVTWTLQDGAGAGELVDADGDGFVDDLPPNGEFDIIATNHLTACGLQNISISAAHGCKGQICQSADAVAATFRSGVGTMVTRTTFPVTGQLCATNRANIGVRNSGLTTVYGVSTYEEVPPGMAYILNSSRYIDPMGVTNAMSSQPTGTGLVGDPLVWTTAQIPVFAQMLPGERVYILIDVKADCDSASSSQQFTSYSRYLDLCGVTNVLDLTVATMLLDVPDLTLTKTVQKSVVDLNGTNVYTLTVDHSGTSAHDAMGMQLEDVLPAGFVFESATIPPDSITGNLLVWSNATLMAYAGGGTSYEIADGPFSIAITGVVTACTSMNNVATLRYGCPETNFCAVVTASRVASSLSGAGPQPASTMSLGLCGGSSRIVVNNNGSTAVGLVITNTAPPGYLFNDVASVTGEFYSTALNVTLAGAPVGKILIVDLSTTNASGAIDYNDEAFDGDAAMDLGNNKTFTLTLNMVSDGSTLDATANPMDLDFADIDPPPPTTLSLPSTLFSSNLCGGAVSSTFNATAIPEKPDPDINIAPNNLILTNGQEVVFTVAILNRAELGTASNLYARVELGSGWSNLVCIATQLTQSSSGTLQMEYVGNTNILIDLPGVELDPLGDEVTLTFTATAYEGQGPLYILGEVVGNCASSAITNYVGTNTLGQLPLADTMNGSTLTNVMGQYYGLDQDELFGAGYEISKTVRYADGGAETTFLTARVGEPLIYRISTRFFGAGFSNIVVSDSMPMNLAYGVPVNYGYSGGLTSAVFDAGAGTFTLEPALITNALSTFVVDIPVTVSNLVENQDGILFTNEADATFLVTGLLYPPTPVSTIVQVVEPDLSLTKTADVSVVRAGDYVTFTNVIEHGGVSSTSAYEVVFVDVLPQGLTFSGINFLTDGIDNDGDGTAEEGDEATLVSGETLTVDSTHNAQLLCLPMGSNVTVIFKALVEGQVVGAPIVNTAAITYRSLTNGAERTGVDGVGGLNDYTYTNSVTIQADALGALVKLGVSSSQTNTVDSPGTNMLLTIGERIVYDIRVDVPQGVVTNMVITELVPAGLDWVGTNTAAGLAFPGVGYEFSAYPGGPVFATNAAMGLVITDTDPTPGSSLTADGGGSNIIFRIPVITNAADATTSNDFFILSLEFVALNTVTNRGLVGGSYSNRNQVTVTDSFSSRAATSEWFSIVEPQLRVMKTLNAGLVVTNDGGDLITILLVASNTAAGLADIYNMQVSDFLANAAFDTNTIAALTPAEGWTNEITATASGATVLFSSLPGTALVAGSAATNSFTVNLAGLVQPNKAYTNQVLIAGDTLYDGMPAGITNRIYSTNALAVIRTPQVSIDKSLYATSETNIPPDSVVTNVQIGERVSYRIDVSLPEATVTNLQVTDLLPAGLAFITNSVVVDTNGFGGTLGVLSNYVVMGTGLVASNGADPVFTFQGQSSVSTNDGLSNHVFSLFIDALVLDVASNVGTGAPVLLTNRVVLGYAAGTAVTNPGPVVVRVQEPVLVLTKNLVQTTADAGDVVEVVFTATNKGTATAYDLVLTDVLNPNYFDTNASVAVSLPTGYVFSVTGSGFTITSDTNSPTGTNTMEPGEFLSFTCQVVMAQGMAPNSTITNTASLAYDSLAGTNLYSIQRSRLTNATDTIGGLNLAMLKTFEATSETNGVDSTGGTLQIGETVSYRLRVTLPEGTVTNLTVWDKIPVGMQYVTNRLDTNAFAGVLAPMSVSGAGTNGAVMAFGFNGNTVVFGDNEATSNSFDLYVDAVSLNVVGNRGVAGSQTIATNTAWVSFTNNPLPAYTNGVILSTNVEPVIWISKSFSTNLMDAGDVVGVTLVVSNTGLATAYDLVVTDVLNTVYFDAASVSNFLVNGGVPAGYTQTVAGSTVWIVSDTNNFATPATSLETGEVVRFTFDVTAAQTVPPNAVITNRTWVYADTISGGTTNQRTVTGQVATAYISTTNLVLLKTFEATSETNGVDSTGRTVQIGETVSYRLRVTLPEGTVTNLTVWDKIPVGMQYVTNRLDTNAFAGVLAPMTVSGAGTNGAVMAFGFNGNTLVSGDNEATSNSFDLYVDAVSLNVVGNRGVAGSQTIATNTAWVSFTNNPLPAYTNGVILSTNVEPVIWISKSFSTNLMDAGDVVGVTLVVSNTGLATAYDLVVTDVLNTVYFDAATVANFLVNGGVPAGYTQTVAGSTVWIVSDTNNFATPATSLETGEVVRFTFDVTAAQTVPPNAVMTNRAWVLADTISGGAAQQRTVTGLVATAVIATPNLVMTKGLAGTSETNVWESGGTNVQVGETVTYVLTLTLPEGTITNLAVTDAIPRGMQYLTNRLDTSAFGGTLGAPLVVTGGTNNGSAVTFTFGGNSVVSNDNLAANNGFTLSVDAVVLNTNGNVGLAGQQTLMTNTASVTFAGPGSTNVSSGSVITRVVEPQLRLFKAMQGPSNGVVVVTLVVTNQGLAPAFEVAVTDRISAVYFQTSTITNLMTPAGYTFAVAGAPGDAVIRLESDGGAMAPTNSIEPGESVTFQFAALLTTTAVGPLTNIAVVATNTTIYGSNVFERFEPPAAATNVLQLPQFEIMKDVLTPTNRPLAVGELVTYLITVTNSGALGFASVSVGDMFPTNYLAFSNATPAPDLVDAGGGLIWSNVGPLAVSARVVITSQFAAVSMTPAGGLTNIAAASIITTNGLPLPLKQDDATNSIIAPAYGLQKTLVSPLGRPALVGEPVTFAITVTNTGAVVLDAVRLVDTFDTNRIAFLSATPGVSSTAAVSVVWSNAGSLAVGGTITVTGRFTALRSTLPGTTTNGVVSIITQSNGMPVASHTNWAEVPIAAPAYVMTKSLLAPVQGTALTGEVVRYQINVTNTGDVLLETVAIEDSYPTNWLEYVTATPSPDTATVGGALGWTNLGPLGVGGMLSITTDFQAVRTTMPGQATNVAIAMVTTTNGVPLPDQTNAAPVRIAIPGIGLTKLAGNAVEGGVEYVLSNDAVQYTYVVTNLGDTYLSSIVVTDNVLGVVGTVSNLAPQAATNLYLTTNITMDVTNIAVVAGVPAFSNAVPIPGLFPVMATNDAIVDVAHPAIGLIKLAGTAAEGGVEYVLSNDAVQYTYVVTNLGDTYLSSIVVTDNVLGVVGTVGNLAPQASTNLYLTTNVTMDVTNVAIVVGVPAFSNAVPIPDLPTVAATNDAIVDVALPAIGLTKLAGNAAEGGVEYVLSNEAVQYTYVVTNLGDTYLSSIVVTDNVLGVVGSVSNLAPQASTNLYLTTNVMMDVTNVAIVVGVPVFSNAVPIPGLLPVAATNDAIVAVVHPAIGLTKLAGNAGEGGVEYALSNEAVQYTYVVTNLGDTYLSSIVVTDNVLGVVGTVNVLAPQTATNLYVTTNVTMNVTNIAIVTGAPAFSNAVPIPDVPVVAATNDAIVEVTHPAIGLTKLAGNAVEGGVEYVLSNDAVQYTYVVTNLGDTYLSSIVVTDNVLGVVGTVSVLAPQASTNLYLTTNVTVDVTNIAIVVGVPAFSNAVPIPDLVPVAATNDAIVEVVHPAIGLTKLAGNAVEGGVEYVLSNDAVQYTYVVTNLGDTYLSSIVVTDNVLGVVGTVSVLAPQAATNLYLTTNVVVDVTNIAIVAGVPAFSNAVPIPDLSPVAATNDAIVEVVHPEIGLIKLAGNAMEGGIEYVLSSNAVQYTYVVTNLGDTYLSSIVVTDNVLGVVGTVGNLAPQAATNLYLTTNVMVDVTNIAIAVGVPAFSNAVPIPDLPPVSATNDAIVDVVQPAVTLLKLAGNAAEGDVEYITLGSNAVTYSYVVTNAGDTYLTNVVVMDDKLGQIGRADLMAPGGVTNFAVTTNILLDVTNIADVVGTPAFSNGVPVPDVPDVAATNDAMVDVVHPAITLLKLAGNASEGSNEYITLGSNAVTYSYVVTNAGDTYLTNVVVTDDKLGQIGVAVVMAPGGVTNFAVITNIMLDVTNVADVVGTPALSNAVPIPDVPAVVATNDAVVVVVHPAIALIKLAGTAVDGDVLHVVAGSDVVYRYGVMNTGDTALTNVQVNDDVLGFIGAVELMLPAATNWLVYTNVSMQADVTNVAIAVGTPAFSNGVPVLDIPDVAATNDAMVDVVRPGYVLTKLLLDPTNRPAIPGEALMFSVSVVNTGDVDMVAVPVWDEFNTNDLAYLGALPAAVLTNGGAVYWADVGPLAAGQGTNLGVTFTALTDTAGQYHTNLVVATPEAPTNYPAFIPATNGAPYTVDVPAVLGNYVWLDADGDGVQDGGEVGVSNVTVTLYNATNAVVATATTDGGGAYLFTNLVPGAYTVEFVPVTGAQITLTQQGGDVAADSDPVRSNGLAAVTLISGETNLTVDAGLYFPATLGNFVWLDVNGNGVQEGGEPGVSNVTVTLYGAASNVVATTLTDGSGAYSFTNLVPASYSVGFTIPAGYALTLRNATNDAALDSDPDRMTGRTALVTLSSGQSDTTLDAGLYVPAMLGNYIWWDLDTNGVQNVGEAVVSNVVVTLLDGTNGVVATTATDVNGNYSFTNLLPATYTVAFAPLAGWHFAPTNGTNNVAMDSDPAPVTGISSAVTLLSGMTNTDVDAGIYVLGRIGQTVWVDVDQDGVPDEDLYRYGLSRVRVSLFRILGGVTNFIGTTLTTNQVVGSVTNNGYFAFEGLPFGLYMVTVSNGLPANLTIRTTPARYIINVGYQAVVLDANFGYNFPPTPVTLKSFAVAYEGDGVRVAWETGVEQDNRGFNVYRSTGFAGDRKRINEELIPGLGTSQGKLYELRDTVPDSAVTYYYWLEDVSFKHESEIHGPAVLRGSVVDVQGAIGRFMVPTGGLSRISYAVMKASSLPVETLDPEQLKVMVDGVEVATYVSSSGDLLRDGDYVMFYAPEAVGGRDCVVAVGTNAMRMELVFARPSRTVGDVWAGVAAGGKTMDFLVSTNYVRYLLADYAMTPVWVMDVTKPAESKLLYGYSYIRATNGLSAVYLSYPGANEAKCLGTADAAVYEVPMIRKAE